MSYRDDMFENVTAHLLWGAVAYADRRNGQEYVKHDHPAYYDEWREEHVAGSTSNKTYAKDALADPMAITPDDYAYGEEIRNYFRGLSFKAIAGKLNDFEKNVMKFVDTEDFGEDREAYYHFAIACSLPASYRRAQTSDNIEAKARESKHIGQPGDKIEADVTVLRTVYSEKWGTHFITVETEEGNVAFFANRVKREAGDKFHIKGKIKRHLDSGETQLNYVKIIK